MAKFSMKVGSTSKTVYVFIQDSSKTTGVGLTGLAFNTAGLTAYYVLVAASATVISLLTQTVTGAWTTAGFVEVDATHCPGLYRFDLPNAALASGVSSTIYLQGATNMAPCLLEIELTNWDTQTALSSTTVGTVTTVTNQLTAAAIATGVWTDTTAGDFTTALSVGKSIMNGVALGTGLTVNTVTNQLTAAAIASGVWKDTTAGDFTVASSVGKSVMNGVALGTGLTVNTVTNQLTAAAIATGVWTDTTAGDFTVSASVGKSVMNGVALGTGLTVNTVTNQLTGAQVATAVWTDTTAGDFTTSASIGKSVMNGVALGTGLTINGYTGNTAQTGDSYARLGAPAGASVSADIAAVKAVFPTNFNALGISAGGHISNVDTLTTYTGNTVQTGDSYARLGAPAGASVSADIAAIKSDTGTTLTDVNTGAGAIYNRLGAPAGASLAADIAAVKTDVDAISPPSAATIAAAVMGSTVETGYTLTQATRLQLSALAGKLSGAAGTTVTIRDVNDTANRIVATVDASGNRTAVTLTP